MDVTLHKIWKLSQLVEMERTALWHSRYAWMLMMSGHNSSARKHFLTALERSEEEYHWLPKEGLARCYDEYGTDYRKAIRWMHDAIDSVPPNLQHVQYSQYQFLAFWNLKLGQIDDALDASKFIFKAGKGFVDQPHRSYQMLEGIYLHLVALTGAGRFEHVLEVILDLANRTSWTSASQRNNLPILLLMFCSEQSMFPVVDRAVEATRNHDFFNLFPKRNGHFTLPIS